MTLRACTALALVLIVVLFSFGQTPEVATQADATQAGSTDGFVRLFDGTLRGWAVQNSDGGNFTTGNGVLRVEGSSGWLRSERRYRDFGLRVGFRFLTPDADSGIFVRAPADGTFARGWPTGSYQVQLRVPSTPSRLPPVGGIFRHGMPAGDTKFDGALVEKRFTGVGAWQTVEIDVSGDTLVVRFNGTEVTRAANIVPSSGFVGIQGETGALEFRTIEIAER